MQETVLRGETRIAPQGLRVGSASEGGSLETKPFVCQGRGMKYRTYTFYGRPYCIPPPSHPFSLAALLLRPSPPVSPSCPPIPSPQISHHSHARMQQQRRCQESGTHGKKRGGNNAPCFSEPKICSNFALSGSLLLCVTVVCSVCRFPGCDAAWARVSCCGCCCAASGCAAASWGRRCCSG